MEKEVRIRAIDGKDIYGTYTHGSKDNLIIFVHGLTGHRNEHMFYNAARFFPKKGYSTFRFDLYSAEKNARKFFDTTLRHHSNDLDIVVQHFKKFKHITLIGHSLGGPTILLSNMKGVQSIVLWDPTENLRKELPTWCKYDKRLDAYRITWAIDVIASKEYYEQMMAIPSMPKRINNLDIPVVIILAGKSILLKKWAKVSECIIIENATHCFDEENAEEQLFKHTLDFLKKHC